MSPIPGKGHDPAPMELTTKDGKKVRLNVPGLPQPVKPLDLPQNQDSPPSVQKRDSPPSPSDADVPA